MKKMTRRAVLAGALAIPSIGRAQSAWPSGIITLVAPAPAGGSVDIIARLVQPGLQKRLGTTVIVENKSGAATSLGANYVAKAPRDGSKWLINADPQALNPAFMSNMPFDSEKDLDPVLMVGTSPNVLAAFPGSQYRTLEDVLAAARKPEGVNFSVIGDTLALVSMVLLNKLAGAHLTPITYRGGAPAVNDTLGGHTQLIAGSASLLAPFFADGKLRAIAQTGPQRHPSRGVSRRHRRPSRRDSATRASAPARAPPRRAPRAWRCRQYSGRPPGNRRRPARAHRAGRPHGERLQHVA